MQQEHKDAIQSNFTSLVERTDLDSVVTALYEKGVFSEQMIEPYRDNNVTPRERKRRLYCDIMRRGPLAFGRLVEGLTELGHWDLVQDLAPDNPAYLSPRYPNSNLSRRDSPPPDENSFVSISTEKNRTMIEIQKKITSMQPQPPAPSLDNPNNSSELTEVPQFKVIMSTEFIDKDCTKPDVELYRSRGRRRGVLLIFSYVQFHNDIEEERRGAELDCKNLKHLFSEMGFKVFVRQDLTRQETLETLESCKDLLLGVESVFVVVSSHGYETGGSDTEIRCSDGKLLSTYDVIEQFNNQRLPALLGVPKVFIFQTCRGRNVEYVWRSEETAPHHMRMPDGDGAGGAAGGAGAGAAALDGTGGARARCEPDAAPTPAAGDRRLAEKALYSDILIAHSTLPRFVSRRDPRLGSWYIQVLCEVFAARAHDCHVDKLLTLVDRKLQERFRLQTSSVDRWGFNKRLYLHPGLYE